jgi:glyoxylase-like metal-dependent hydrolase (beta-lactamase superfamily II)
MKKRTLFARLTLLIVAISLPVAALAASKSNSESKSALKLYVFECGNIEVGDISMFQPEVDNHSPKKLVDSCYLIVHPKGTLIWDAGLSDELAKAPDGKFSGGGFTMQVTNTLASQLEKIGVAPDSIKYLGISHMHSDHIGNANLFPKATLLMQKEEYEAGFGPTPEKFGFDPKNYPTLHDNPVQKLQGDHDVFGDGRVVIKRELGHTPGHQALYLKLKHSGNILLSGDLVHYTDNWINKRVPGFNFDKAQSLKTMEEVERFLKANKATLWIQHDMEQNATIRHAPEFYD